MKYSIIYKSFLFVMFLFIGATLAQKDITTSFNVGSSGNIDINIHHGNIVFHPGSSSEVKVIAKNLLEKERSQFNSVLNSKTVTVTFKGTESKKFSLDITLPSGFDVDAKTGGGNIEVNGNFKGNINLNSNGGNIQTEDVKGKLSIHTDGGNIKTGNLSSSVEILTKGGNIKLGSVDGKAEVTSAGGNIKVGNISSSAEINTHGGNIKISDIGGNAEINTGGGNVSLGSVSGSAEVHTGGGNISLDAATGKVEVSTGGGNIKLENINGEVEAGTGAGNIYAEINPKPGTNSELHTGVGNINLKLPSNAKVTVVAETGSFPLDKKDSAIHSDFPESRSSDKGSDEKTFVINGGGANIYLNTKMGDINIEKR